MTGTKRLKIKELRKKIDEIDLKVAALLDKRFEIAEEISLIKRAGGEQMYDPERENEIFDNVGAVAKTLSSRDIKSIYAFILDTGRKFLEKKLLSR